ncbi:MAG: putative toxin-antitoxin system toxin component, PIN family [Betaproteobacteria bacterium]
MRLVLDTDVVVAGMRSPAGASAALLLAALQRRLTLCTNVALMLEYEAVCSRAAHRTAAGLTRKEVDIFLDAIAALVEPVDTHFLWRPQLRDPADEMVLEAAVNGRAQAIVTFKVRDFGTAAARFGVDLLLPREALALLKG